jgi:hypothetical protein
MDEFLRVEKKVRPCPSCRVGILTLTTQSQQDDGTWKVVRVQRNCGHTFESDLK